MTAPDANLPTLYARYGLLLERRCARIVGTADARDAAHDAFLQALAPLAKLDREEERVALLYRISTNVCLNLLRNRQRRGARWLADVSSLRPEAHEAAAQSDARLDVHALLERAGDDTTRSLVLFVLLDGMSQGEAAELLGISRATANSKLMRFRERARQEHGALP